MRVQYLGPIKNCDLTLGQQTMFMGKNNTGKTYISYLYYGIFKKLDELKNELLETYVKEYFNDHADGFTFTFDRKALTDYLIKHCTSRLNNDIYALLPKLFNLNESAFEHTKIKIEERDTADFLESFAQIKLPTTTKILSMPYWVEIDIEEKGSSIVLKLNDIQHIHQKNNHANVVNTLIIEQAFQHSIVYILVTKAFHIPHIIYIPAERNGINVFRKELTLQRSLDSFDVDINSRQTEKYPLPISDYIRYLATLEQNLAPLEEKEQFTTLDEDNHEGRERLQNKIWDLFSNKILNGKYEYDYKSNEHYYHELDSISSDNFNDPKFKHKYRNNKILLQHASSSVKSLFGLEFYLRYELSVGDVLFIDEPEMNLDPMRQIQFAQLLSALSRYGVRVIVSSHSDYLIRATTNQILKARLDDEKQWHTMGYYFEYGTVTALPSLEDMDYIELFDNANRELDDAYFNLRDRLLAQIKHDEHSNKV